MDGSPLARIRWRRRGAWLWPAFTALTVLDAIFGHLLPPAGQTQSVVAAALLALLANLLAIVLCSRPLGALLRRARPDLPVVVARNYAGVGVICAVALILFSVGLAHRGSVMAMQRTQRDAVVRAQAFIGDRAPDRFRRNLQSVSVFAVQPGEIYRICVPSADGTRDYCVIVKTGSRFANSVSFAGYEPNSLFAQGAG
jgi:hypothetical protein